MSIYSTCFPDVNQATLAQTAPVTLKLQLSGVKTLYPAFEINLDARETLPSSVVQNVESGKPNTAFLTPMQREHFSSVLKSQ